MKLRNFRLAVVVLALAGVGLVNAEDFCQKTTDHAVRACQVGARSDYLLALGKCDNLADPASRKACRQQAAADLAETLQGCDDQESARLTACEKLGPAPYDPVIDPANFVTGVTNPYFPLKPGTTFVYEGQTANGFEHVEFAVTRNTKVILGVTCIEVHDTVLLDGKLAEDTLDWFAQDKAGNVWYFGENTHELVGGLITTIDGSFVAGENGAKAGILMKAHPAIGDFYRQEFDLGNAEDFAEVLSLAESVRVPVGAFPRGLQTQETTPLDPSLRELKFYAPGIGHVLTIDQNTGDRVKLVEIRR